MLKGKGTIRVRTGINGLEYITWSFLPTVIKMPKKKKSKPDANVQGCQ